MNRKSFKLVFIAALFVFASGGCDFYYRNMPFVPMPIQSVSGPVEIGRDWVEIFPPQALKPYGNSNWLNIEFVGYKKDNHTDGEDGKVLNLADGRKTKIEAFLYDDKGESYELQIGGTSSGVTFYRRMSADVVDGKPERNVVRFPIDRIYTKLKIKSEIPISCDKIEWIGSNPK